MEGGPAGNSRSRHGGLRVGKTGTEGAGLLGTWRGTGGRPQKEGVAPTTNPFPKARTSGKQLNGV